MSSAGLSLRLAQWMERPGPRLILLGLLLLVLLIPLGMMESRVYERGSRSREASDDVARSWGGAQSLAGPMLRIPYRQRWNTLENGKTVEHVKEGWLWLPPRRLATEARLHSEVRHRGIFEVPVYRAGLSLKGDFLLPEPAALPMALQWLDFGRTELVIGIAEPGALAANSRVRVGEAMLTLEPTALSLGAQGVHAALPQGLPQVQLAAGVSFDIALDLRGSTAFQLAPVARETTLSLSSNWPHPQFGGLGLPASSRISDEGFVADWSVSHLGRGYPALWLDGEVSRQQIDAAMFGVELCVPVSPYRMAERIAKYGSLLLLLSFAAIWVMELLGGRPLHPVQMLLLGGSLCLFGLLQLALAEHLGFGPAFALAAAAVVLQASFYARTASGSTRRGATLGALLAAWFGYLYAVLQAEDLAFLFGALALFAALTGVMWATRGVNWSAGSRWDVADATVDLPR